MKKCTEKLKFIGYPLLLRRFLVLAVLSLSMALLCACADNSSFMGDGPVTSRATSAKEAETTLVPGWILPREEWNIEIKFLGIEDGYIKTAIIDRDNHGFSLNTQQYELEFFEDDIWQAVNQNAENSNDLTAYAVSSKDEEYIYYEVRNKLPADTELKTGRYRITKVISGREFSCEFDLMID